MSDALQSQLQAYYTRAFPAKQGVQISNLASITGGMDHEMYAFDVAYGPAGAREHEGLVLRIYPRDNAYATSAHEFHGMRRLHEAGYPVPQVLLLERETSPFGKPFVMMERIEGHALGPLLFSAPEKQQRLLLTLLCALLARLHVLDWRPFVDDIARYETGGPYVFVDQGMRLAYDTLRRFPTWDLLPFIKWLEERREQVPCLRPSLVHGDFHPWNVLLRDDGSAVVIDWQGLQVWDARRDVAWVVMVMTAFGRAEWREPILREYEHLTGAKVEQIEYFEVGACISFLLILLIAVSEGAEKMHPNAVAMTQMGAFKRAYNLLQERTGIRWVAVERLLASLS